MTEPYLVLVDLAPGLLGQEPVGQQRIAPESRHVGAKDSMHLSDRTHIIRSREVKTMPQQSCEDEDMIATPTEEGHLLLRTREQSSETIFQRAESQRGAVVQGTYIRKEQPVREAQLREARGGEGRTEGSGKEQDGTDTQTKTATSVQAATSVRQPQPAIHFLAFTSMTNS